MFVFRSHRLLIARTNFSLFVLFAVLWCMVNRRGERNAIEPDVAICNFEFNRIQIFVHFSVPRRYDRLRYERVFADPLLI